MNKCVSKRIISKQEATVLLADLPLFLCSETIENVSISDGKRVRVGDEDRQSKAGTTFIQLYKRRPSALEHMSLYMYFHYIKNSDPRKPLIIPNFVGLSGTPCFPVTPTYARHTLIVHRPWRQYPRCTDWVAEFNHFINSPDVPKCAKLTYERVMQRYIDKMTNYEAKATEVDHSGNPIDRDDEELMALTGLKQGDEYDPEDAMFKQLEKGYDYTWDKPAMVRLCVS